MRKVLFILLTSFFFGLCSCSKSTFTNDEDNQTHNHDDSKLQHEKTEEYYIDNKDFKILLQNDYEINTDVFEIKDNDININIKYPQIDGFDEVSSQNRINELIKEAALRPYFHIKNSLSEGTEWPINYSIMYATDKLMSIRFEGYIYARGNSNGINWVYSTNIDMLNQQLLNMDELFDSTFEDKLNSQYFKGIDVDTSTSDDNAINEVFYRFQDDFKSGDNNFYFTGDKFIIILPINNYYQFASTYQDLRDSMKDDNFVWDYILSDIS